MIPVNARLTPMRRSFSTQLLKFPSISKKIYWWAYLHPNAVRLFERQWLVNLILWGNFNSLRDSALAELRNASNQRLLQIACVYGDFTQKITALLDDGTLDIVDVAPIQLNNLQKKLPALGGSTTHHTP